MTGMDVEAARRDICEVGRRMYARGLVAANDGNISVRLGPDRILATPTLVSKGFMTPEMLAIVDMEGALVEGSRKPSSELKMHLRVYRDLPGAGAVVHAHPTAATGFAVAGLPLEEPFMPELVVSLGSVPVAPYATPSTEEVPESIAPYLAGHVALLLANHGALTWGEGLFEAYFRMETLESYAGILAAALAVGKPRPIPAAKLGSLLALRPPRGI